MCISFGLPIRDFHFANEMLVEAMTEAGCALLLVVADRQIARLNIGCNNVVSSW